VLNAMKIKSEKDIKIMREGGRRHSVIMDKIARLVSPGVRSSYLNDMALKLIEEGGDKPAFLNYKPYGASRPYPASLCVSVNDEIVHGIPNEKDKVLKEGDIVGLDCGLIHKGMVTDMAVTVPVGKISREALLLIQAAKYALTRGISAAKAGNTVGDIGFEIMSYIKPYGYGIVKELAGHGVGYKVHEDPYVPNYGKKGEGPELLPGAVIAIEPMLNLGTARIKLDPDGYTYRTADGKISAHFEHTVLISKEGPEILTQH